MQLDEQNAKKLIEALTSAVETQTELLKTVKKNESKTIEAFVDIIETKIKAGKEWRFAFVVFACFMIVLVTIFLGFLNS